MAIFSNPLLATYSVYARNASIVLMCAVWMDGGISCWHLGCRVAVHLSYFVWALLMGINYANVGRCRRPMWRDGGTCRW